MSDFPPALYFSVLLTFLQQATCILGWGGGQQNNLEKGKRSQRGDGGL